MSTGLVARRPPGAAVSPRNGRLHALRHTSPGRLRLRLIAIVVAGVLAGLAGAVTAHAAATGTSDLGDRAQPLLVEAETVYSALADADTTAAQAFLAGGLEPAALTARYNDDLRRATEALTSAARRTPDDSPAAASIEALSSGVARYAALVATARADNRQGLPVGASYLSAASQLNRGTLLPEADKLFTTARADVDAGFGSARGIGWVVLSGILLLVLLGTLIRAQLHLSRHMRRTFNVPLLAATGLTLVLMVLTGVIVTRQYSHLGRAAGEGADPVQVLAQARILALRARGDEALTLVARGSSSQEDDYRAAITELTGALAEPYAGSIRPLTDHARDDIAAYDRVHTQVQTLDTRNGDYDGAVKLAIGPRSTTVFESARSNIDAALENRKKVFTSEIRDAGTGLNLLTVLGPLLALAVCACAAAGIRARLEEYR